MTDVFPPAHLNLGEIELDDAVVLMNQVTRDLPHSLSSLRRFLSVVTA
jgi:hypothetical protein